MATTIDYAYYSETYGGQISEAAFDAALGRACDHVRWFCHDLDPQDETEEELYRRALCACCDAYAEHGDGSGFSLGDFTWRPTQYSARGGSAVDVASRACVEILGLTTMAFAGVR